MPSFAADLLRAIRHPSTSLFLNMLLAVIAGACSPDYSSAPTFAGTTPLEVDPDLHSIARALAFSLESDTLRARLFRAFQTSNLPERQITLEKYLAVDQMLSDRLQQNAPSSTLAEFGNLQLSIPGALDRQYWTGDDRAIIIAVDLSVLNDPDVTTSSIPGFRIGGDSVRVASFTWIPETLIVLMPADSATALEYDANPIGTILEQVMMPTVEATISTRFEESELLREKGYRLDQNQLLLPPEFIVTDALPEPDVDRLLSEEQPRVVDENDEFMIRGSSAVGYELAQIESFDECDLSLRGSRSAGVDVDGDDLLDECEFLVASRFAPVLMFDEHEDAPERETYWAVKRSDLVDQGLSIFYALGYYQDTGQHAHNGDSEFIVMDVGYIDDSRWAVRAVVMSAHHGTKFPPGADRTIGTFSPQWADTVGGQPMVWVSRGKHANYKSRDHCNGGFYNWVLSVFRERLDICGDNPRREVVVVRRDGHLGGGGMVLVNCTWSQIGPRLPGMECLWDKHRLFRGWHGGDKGVTPYGQLLETAGFTP